MDDFEAYPPLIPKKDRQHRSNFHISSFFSSINLFKLFCGLIFIISTSFLYSGPSPRRSSQSNISLAKKGTIMYQSLSNTEMKELFDEFIEVFGRVYASEEEKEEKFSNFKSFLSLVDTRNSAEEEKGGTAKHGITIFADISDEEFQTRYLTYKPLATSTFSSSRSSTKPRSSKKVTTFSENEEEKAPSYVNWADVYTTAVKDQGYCGACWAFSAASQIESDAIRSGLLTTADSLSAQQIVSCDLTNFGCYGGNTETAYSYVQAVGGLSLDSDYPYSSFYDQSGNCKSDESLFKVTVQQYYSLLPAASGSSSSDQTAEDLMVEHMLSTGPISTCMAASSWSSYTSGVVSTCDKSVNHCVQVVGIDVENEYWVIRNSWGTDWGEKGYIYVKTGQNMCVIGYDPTYTEVSLVKGSEEGEEEGGEGEGGEEGEGEEQEKVEKDKEENDKDDKEKDEEDDNDDTPPPYSPSLSTTSSPSKKLTSQPTYGSTLSDKAKTGKPTHKPSRKPTHSPTPTNPELEDDDEEEVEEESEEDEEEKDKEDKGDDKDQSEEEEDKEKDKDSEVDGKDTGSSDPSSVPLQITPSFLPTGKPDNGNSDLSSRTNKPTPSLQTLRPSPSNPYKLTSKPSEERDEKEKETLTNKPSLPYLSRQPTLSPSFPSPSSS